MATVGDWVVGTGSKSKGKENCFVYVMCVSEVMSYNDYWQDSRFTCKRPHFRGSLKQAYGDNVYFQDEHGKWNQIDSHHSLENGLPNEKNVKHDTQTPRVLVSSEYAYWGRDGPEIPEKFRNYRGCNICQGTQGYKCKFPSGFADEFVQWFRSLHQYGCLNTPIDWPDST